MIKKLYGKMKLYFQKRQAIQQAKMRQEFLPEALEIIEKPTSPVGHFVVLVTVIIVLFFVVWSVLGKMDEIVTARGKIITISGLQEVQSVNTGIVEQICVKEGEHVVAGQTLILVDDSINTITLQNMEESLGLLSLENRLLNDILEGLDISSMLSKETDYKKIEIISYVSALQKEYLSQKKQLDSAVEQHMSQIGIEEEALEKLEENMCFLEEQKKSIQSLENYYDVEEKNTEKLSLSITYKEQELKDYQELYELGAVSKAEIEQREIELEQLKKDYEIQEGLMAYENYDYNLQIVQLDNQLIMCQKDIESQKKAIELTKQQYEQTVESLNALEAEYQVTISNLIVENEDKLSTQKANHEIQTINAEQQKIVSPVDGIVNTLEINTEGVVLTTAQPIATIVADDEQMIVEMMILNQDIGCVEVGQSVVMKLDSFNFQEYGKLEGEIVSISPDAVLDEQKGWVYIAKVELDESNFREKNPDVEIEIGMECTAEIKIGERRIIEFFLEPIVEHFDGSLKVR